MAYLPILQPVGPGQPSVQVASRCPAGALLRANGNDQMPRIGSSEMTQNPAAVQLALRIEAETHHSETILRCPVDGKRLPVSEVRCVGSLVVYCRHCGKGVRISIEIVD